MPIEPVFAHARKTGLADIYGLWQDGINATAWANRCLSVVCPFFNG